MPLNPPFANEGPRDRYARTDGRDFGDVELLALVLGTGTAQRSSRTIAADLVDRFGGPAGIAVAPVHALAQVHGVGPARAVRLHAACRLSRRAWPRAGRVIRSADQAWLALRTTLEGLPVEELHALYLDARNRIRLHRRVSVGTARFTFVDPPSVLGPALACGATSLLIAHNHPSGDPEPSSQDIESTRRLALAARAVGLPLLDHLVTGEGCYVSLAERGVLGPWTEPTVSTTG